MEQQRVNDSFFPHFCASYCLFSTKLFHFSFYFFIKMEKIFYLYRINIEVKFCGKNTFFDKKNTCYSIYMSHCSSLLLMDTYLDFLSRFIFHFLRISLTFYPMEYLVFLLYSYIFHILIEYF